MRAGARAALLGLGLAALAPGSGAAQANDPGGGAAARTAAQALQAAIAELDAAEEAGNRVAALTSAIRAHEQALGGLRDGLRDVTLREAAMTRRLEADSARIAQLLGVMTAMQRTTGPLLLLHPAGPLGTARAGALLADVTPAIQAEAAALRAELNEISALRTAQEDTAQTLQAGLRSLQEARVALSQAVADRTDLPEKLTESPEALARLAAGADSLTGFADLLRDIRVPPDTRAGAFEAARGTLPLPAPGRVVGRFGEDGDARPGLTLATAPETLVTAPWAATIRYLGPLLDYGNVIILEPEEDYLLILTGLGTLYGRVGQVVPPGAPLGLTGAASDGRAAAQVGGVPLSQTLYIELRAGNDPIDPAPWFEQTRQTRE